MEATPTETTALLPSSRDSESAEGHGVREENADGEALDETRRPDWLKRSIQLSVSMMAASLSLALALTIMSVYAPSGFRYSWHLRDATGAITALSLPVLAFDVIELQLRPGVFRPFLMFVEGALDALLALQTLAFVGPSLNFFSDNYCYSGGTQSCHVFLPWFLALAGLYLTSCTILGLAHFLLLILRVRNLWSNRSWPSSNESLSTFRFTVGPLVFQASLGVEGQQRSNAQENNP
ncbi:hypothetical protein GQ53DRAFT_805619 [Thozetella sp. PMI_491]|nr:hypothetical protein GQ53DRAFT_805619 [Thozetella sp. PMI_491]